MTTVIPVPTLSTNDWVSDNAPKLDYLLAYWVSTQVNQSSIYRDVTSMQAVIEKYHDDMETCCSQLSSSLQLYLGRYYEEVVVSCRHELYNEKVSQTQVKFILGINYTHSGVVYSADRIISTHNGKFKSISDANNA